MSDSTISVILVCGGSCSGKSVFARMFTNAFILEMDHFYVGKDKMIPQPDGSLDFDAPESVDIADVARTVVELQTGNPVTIPVYDMVTSDRVGTQIIQLKPEHKFIVIPGIFAFHSPLRELGTLKIFIDTPLMGCLVSFSTTLPLMVCPCWAKVLLSKIKSNIKILVYIYFIKHDFLSKDIQIT